jgi:hypothetical protein
MDDSDIPIADMRVEESQSGLTRFSPIMSPNPILKFVKETYRTPAGIKAVLAIAHACADLCNNSERVHERLFAIANSKDFGLRFPYYRFDADRDMDKIQLDEWKRMNEMVAFTRKYLSEGVTREQMSQCVESVLNPPAIECQ